MQTMVAVVAEAQKDQQKDFIFFFSRLYINHHFLVSVQEEEATCEFTRDWYWWSTSRRLYCQHNKGLEWCFALSPYKHFNADPNSCHKIQLQQWHPCSPICFFLENLLCHRCNRRANVPARWEVSCGREWEDYPGVLFLEMHFFWRDCKKN